MTHEKIVHLFGNLWAVRDASKRPNWSEIWAPLCPLLWVVKLIQITRTFRFKIYKFMLWLPPLSFPPKYVFPPKWKEYSLHCMIKCDVTVFSFKIHKFTFWLLPLSFLPKCVFLPKWKGNGIALVWHHCRQLYCSVMSQNGDVTIRFHCDIISGGHLGCYWQQHALCKPNIISNENLDVYTSYAILIKADGRIVEEEIHFITSVGFICYTIKLSPFACSNKLAYFTGTTFCTS